MKKLFSGLYKIINSMITSLANHNISAFSGEATLFIIISAFPFAIFLLNIIKFTPLTEQSFISFITNILPDYVARYVIPLINEIYRSSSKAVISISAITLLWSASRGFMSLVRGFNSVYRTAETRGYFALRVYSLIYTIVFAILIILTLIVLVYGNNILFFLTKSFPQISNIALLILNIRSIVSMGVYMFFFLFMYTFLPNRKSTLMYELPGAVIASSGWLGFSYIYSFYVDNFHEKLTMYGSLSTIIFLMVWLYFCIYILFIGAEVNDKLRQFIEVRKESRRKNND